MVYQILFQKSTNNYLQFGSSWLNLLPRIPRHDPGIPFKCDLFGSPYVIKLFDRMHVIKRSRRGNRPKLLSHHLQVLHIGFIQKTFTNCNACSCILYYVFQLHRCNLTHAREKLPFTALSPVWLTSNATICPWVSEDEYYPGLLESKSR